MIYTTLNAIREHLPCEDGWKKLLKHLGKKKADDKRLALTTVLKSNGIEDAIWCLRAVEGHDREICLYALWCIRQGKRLVRARPSPFTIPVSRGWAGYVAAHVASKSADSAALAAAGDAWVAARDAAWAVVGDAARAAVRAAQAEQFRKVFGRVKP